MKKRPFYLKIIIVIMLSLFVSNLFIKNVFLANSPKIRPGLDSYLSSKISNFLQDKTQSIARLFKKDLQQAPKTVLQHIPLQSISKGVYASSEGTSSYTLINAGEVEWLEYTFNVNGKEIKIKVPKDQQPPSQEVMNALYK